MSTILVAHGAWTGGWFWGRMFDPLAKLGHELIVPTLTGLGERQHLAGPDVDLETHIADVLEVLVHEDRSNVVLLGHSYGGMVATAVAERSVDRVRKLIYLDAFVPRDGECLFDLLPPEASSRMRESALGMGEGWKVPPNPMPPDTSAADAAWAVPLRVAQPLKTFEQSLRLNRALPDLPRAYVYCARPGPGDVFRQFSQRAQREPGWQHIELDASHNPHVTIPQELASLLHALCEKPVRGGAPRSSGAPTARHRLER